MIWTKWAHQSAKLQTFDCSRKISPNFYYDRLLSSEELYLMSLKIDVKFEEKLICYLKNDKNLVKFDPNTQKSTKNAHLFAPIVQNI